jgi:hypothetical protein
VGIIFRGGETSGVFLFELDIGLEIGLTLGLRLGGLGL